MRVSGVSLIYSLVLHNRILAWPTKSLDNYITDIAYVLDINVCALLTLTCSEMASGVLTIAAVSEVTTSATAALGSLSKKSSWS